MEIQNSPHVCFSGEAEMRYINFRFPAESCGQLWSGPRNEQQNISRRNWITDADLLTGKYRFGEYLVPVHPVICSLIQSYGCEAGWLDDTNCMCSGGDIVCNNIYPFNYAHRRLWNISFPPEGMASPIRNVTRRSSYRRPRSATWILPQHCEPSPTTSAHWVFMAPWIMAGIWMDCLLKNGTDSIYQRQHQQWGSDILAGSILSIWNDERTLWPTSKVS